VPHANKVSFEVEGAGHYGIFSGKRWREIVYPQIIAFIRKHTRSTPVRSLAMKQVLVTKQLQPQTVTRKIPPSARKA
jgi:poly(3-hydroxybutyrate) depolymerase